VSRQVLSTAGTGFSAPGNRISCLSRLFALRCGKICDNHHLIPDILPGMVSKVLRAAWFAGDWREHGDDD
jgi:hypothetical protein